MAVSPRFMSRMLLRRSSSSKSRTQSLAVEKSSLVLARRNVSTIRHLCRTLAGVVSQVKARLVTCSRLHRESSLPRETTTPMSSRSRRYSMETLMRIASKRISESSRRRPQMQPLCPAHRREHVALSLSSSSSLDLVSSRCLTCRHLARPRQSSTVTSRRPL